VSNGNLLLGDFARLCPPSNVDNVIMAATDVPFMNWRTTTIMKNATELLEAYLSEIRDPAAAAALFAPDGVRARRDREVYRRAACEGAKLPHQESAYEGIVDPRKP